MRWEAANIKKSATLGREDGSKKSSETVEAALARLTRSYSAAMNCIGSLHRLASLQQQEKEPMQRVADAARSTLERTVLVDPLISESLAPTWYQVAKRRADDNTEEQWAFMQYVRPDPALLTSSSHQSTVRELAYLSLVNYADLLVKACCQTNAELQQERILDRGVVPYIPPLEWNNEQVEFTIRLAVAALCDASDLDGSDPTLWLKLACAARRLTSVSPEGESYDRLERHALERGRTALPPDAPPNRLIVRALAQHHEDKDACQEYPPKLYTPEETPSLVLDLPRYSWSMLGRMLLRACREGSEYRPHYFSTETSFNRQQQPFGSPRIVLKLSPMLALPSEALGTICQYLDNASVWKFEATCRALSASILSARASMERRSSVLDARALEENDKEQPASEGTAAASNTGAASVPSAATPSNPSTSIGPLSSPTTKTNATASDPNVTDVTAASGDVAGSSTAAAQQNTPPSNRQTSGETASSENEESAYRSQRTSKRVQSKLITSGKLAERKAKRNSVDFCFIATLFGCTKGDEKYQAALKEEIDWDDPIPGGLWIHSSQDQSPTKSVSNRQQRETAGISSRMGDASLTAFVKKWSANNSGPLDILSRYLTHIAMHVEEVFSIDPDGTVAPFVIESIDTLLKRSGSHQGLEPSWYGTRNFRGDGNIREYIEVFSINLLNAELRLRMCERVAFGNNGYDDDGTVVAVLVPVLLSIANELEIKFLTIEHDREWLSLKARLHWLASGFYFWWGRASQNIRESREAESRGLEHIDEALQTLRLPPDDPIESLRTPQLESPARSEEHWKVLSRVSLASFRDELQASSVVSVARERFVEEVGQLEEQTSVSGEESASRELTGDEKIRLAQIGSDLVSRYSVPEEGTNPKLLELFDDFLEINGDELVKAINGDSRKGDKFAPEQWKESWDLLPSDLPKIDKLLVTPTPSILSVLVVCMHAKDGSRSSLLLLLSHLAVAGFARLQTLVRKASGNTLAEGGFRNSGDDDFSDSDDSFASDTGAETAEKKGELIRVERCAQVIQFLMEKIRDIYQNAANDNVASFPSSKECLALVRSSLAFSADWFRDMVDKDTILSFPLDVGMFLSTHKLARSLIESEANIGRTRSLESIFFAGLTRILISQRKEFFSVLRPNHGKRMGRAVRQKVCLNRADYIGTVSSEMAYMLSFARSKLVKGEMYYSYLIRGFSLSGEELEKDEGLVSSSSLSRLASLSESVLSLWKYMASHESGSTHTVRVSGAAGGSSFDRPIVETLYAPIASLIVGLCGSAITIRSMSGQETSLTDGSDRLCINEFYDSDASAVDMAVDSEGSGVGNVLVKKELLMRMCHAAHCITLVTGELNTKAATCYKCPTTYDQEGPPHLPLVVSRVANHFADILLSEFGADGNPTLKRNSLWASEYPVGVRSIGGLLDFTLYKAYRALHGFVLSSTNAQQSISGMDHLALTNDDIDPSQVFKPESTLAAAQLYRCVFRASGTVRRKSPPKEALECIGSALPPIEETERSKFIRSFLFSCDEYFTDRDVIDLLNLDSEQVLPLNNMPDSVWEADCSPGSQTLNSDPLVQEMEDVRLVRKGICRELAQGPPPSFSASSTDGTKSSKGTTGNQDGKADERDVAANNEGELSKKFEAIVDDLCYGEAVNSKGWYDASQCLLMKADLIADRLGLSKGFSRAKDFHIPTNRVDLEALPLSDLIDEQEKEYKRKCQGWVPYIGKDLSVYIRYQWASFPSLRDCFEEIGNCGYRERSENDDDNYAAHVWTEIGSLYDKGDFIGWQQAWGGLFVGALRKMALRCMYVALYLLRRHNTEESSEGFLPAEIAESLGISYYSELMGSQMYGYPMHVMTDHRKRQLAETALTCFEFATEASGDATIDEVEESRQTWDLLFMKGKCNEKIASTFKKEAFRYRQVDMTDGSEPTRAYERHMRQALQDYAASYREAKAVDDEGGLGEIHGGGSTHGLTEVLYRLHASRLKCLLYAVKQKEGERDTAELEALRLTMMNWFHAPNETELDGRDTRGRVWAVLVDVVSAMAQCRIDQPFFHRSVYRHAQALMWSPVLHDPVSGMADGSLGLVPVTRGHLLRGFNSTTPCATSVEAILNPLFEKKRPQICAVWVTNASAAQSPFELLNNSVRKYDSLRGKYISAYIDTLRLCKRKTKIEALLQSIASSPRDLPSFFQATALEKGGTPELPHMKESLLVKGRSLVSSGFIRNATREANSALASVVLEEISPDGGKKNQEETLKAAYACFLRLNCTVDDLRRTRAWKYGQASIPEVDALCQAYLDRKDHKKVQTETSNWVGGGQKTAVLEAAIEKCQELFPQLPKHLYGKRKARSRSKTKATDSAPPTEASSRKRKEPGRPSPPDLTPQTFAVTVPDGLTAGDKFDTTVELGNGSNKKIRLTVPAGNPQKLQFSLVAPAPTSDDRTPPNT